MLRSILMRHSQQVFFLHGGIVVSRALMKTMCRLVNQFVHPSCRTLSHWAAVLCLSWTKETQSLTAYLIMLSNIIVAFLHGGISCLPNECCNLLSTLLVNMRCDADKSVAPSKTMQLIPI